MLTTSPVTSSLGSEEAYYGSNERMFTRRLRPTRGPVRAVPGTPGARVDGAARLAVGGDGRMLAAWYEDTGGAEPPNEERAAFTDGGAWGSAAGLAPTADDGHSLVSKGFPFLLADGTALVVWGRGFPMAFPMLAVAAPGTTRFGVAFPLASGTGEIAHPGDAPTIAAAGSGDAIVVAWALVGGGIDVVTRGPGTPAPPSSRLTE